jgi:hypothetical protein
VVQLVLLPSAVKLDPTAPAGVPLIVAWPSGLLPLVETFSVKVLAPAPISMMLSLSGVTVMPESVASQVSKAFAMAVSSVEPMTLWPSPPQRPADDQLQLPCLVSRGGGKRNVGGLELDVVEGPDRVLILRRRRAGDRAGRRDLVHQAAERRGAAFEHEPGRIDD